MAWVNIQITLQTSLHLNHDTVIYTNDTDRINPSLCPTYIWQAFKPGMWATGVGNKISLQSVLWVILHCGSVSQLGWFWQVEQIFLSYLLSLVLADLQPMDSLDMFAQLTSMCSEMTTRAKIEAKLGKAVIFSPSAQWRLIILWSQDNNPKNYSNSSWPLRTSVEISLWLPTNRLHFSIICIKDQVQFHPRSIYFELFRPKLQAKYTYTLSLYVQGKNA